MHNALPLFLRTLYNKYILNYSRIIFFFKKFITLQYFFLQTSISQNNVYIIQWDIILNFIK
ncbi:LOW QUALITY PROTEIN: hypothetical protein PFUGPA_04550 [Plasmodium falciparum Palo Alto/Uganda]|uniref:Uncharacterized protein n=2 Tax=Plasmodium falciparum TaxID=5833 RepID=W4ITY4_PLAFP|nr:LOW QUALITY PROTEIN: hypothetical protein PFUGPA_04550 [Plasmodium falciparum Palo Alto/Uganda]EUR77413.1 LOW QUALITY PROTEIN: hypothetical protein PFBG_00990 [Plasmodium falciparum 7G8]